MDSILLRGIERIIVVIGAIVFAYLGYRLYLFGVEKGTSHLTAESSFYKFAFSGTGPGLFFMAFGGIVLISALFTGGASKNKIIEGVSPVKEQEIGILLERVPILKLESQILEKRMPMLKYEETIILEERIEPSLRREKEDTTDENKQKRDINVFEEKVLDERAKIMNGATP